MPLGWAEWKRRVLDRLTGLSEKCRLIFRSDRDCSSSSSKDQVARGQQGATTKFRWTWLKLQTEVSFRSRRTLVLGFDFPIQLGAGRI